MSKVSKTNKKVNIINLPMDIVDSSRPSSTIIHFLKSEHKATFVKYIRCMENERLVYFDKELEHLELSNGRNE